ncbi:hypothetical protein INT46_007343 [Mucor plumbeus]|uniref:Uncharacterized protein n=1 Tax=Mucor plumbeus TaxID=97098 RepID=A0A8H7QP77_9FUNG|nr:hypothetical protein INT46_007343 [Mucor plumbeus]
MAPSLSGQHTLISATSGITFPKKAVLGKLKTRKDVEIYPDGLETEGWQKLDNKLQFYYLELTVKHGDSLTV